MNIIELNETKAVKLRDGLDRLIEENATDKMGLVHFDILESESGHPETQLIGWRGSKKVEVEL